MFAVLGSKLTKAAYGRAARLDEAATAHDRVASRFITIVRLPPFTLRLRNLPAYNEGEVGATLGSGNAMMKAIHAAVMAGLALGLMSGTAKAAVTDYNFSFDSNFSFGSGNFFGVFEVMNNEIVSISGSGASIGTITSLLTPGSYEANDNSFSPAGPYVDHSGVSFTTSLGGPINLYSIFNAYGAVDGGVTVLGTLSVNPSTVPLPSSAPMFGAALLALGAVGYGVKRKKEAAAA